jgi:hypothetical protein
MEGQLFTLSALTTMAGASLATFLFVQITKSIVDRIAKWLPTDLYAAFVSFIILLLSQLGTGANGSDWRVYYLCFLNGLLVWATAGKIQNLAVYPPGEKGDKK